MNERTQIGAAGKIASLIFAGAIATLVAGKADAQYASRSVTWPRTELTGRTTSSMANDPGKPIVSLPCDPMMSAEQEAKIIGWLNEESKYDWPPDTPLTQVAKDLSQHSPVVIDSRALEEIGLSDDVGIGAGALFDQAEPPNRRDTEKTKWWKQTGSEKQSERPSLIADLQVRLRDLELVIMIRHRQIVITTVESAEDDLATRIYDVTPLLNSSAQPDRGAYAVLSPYHSVSEEDSLMDLIETTIDCDTWEALGGNSTMMPAKIRGRSWLVTSTTTMTHWKIQRLLDQLNR